MKDTQTKNNQQQPTWKKYFRGWNLLINFAIAFIPSIIVTVVLLDLGFPKALANALPIVSFVYLVGIVREKFSNKAKQKDSSGEPIKNTESRSRQAVNKKIKIKSTKGFLAVIFVLLVAGGWFYWYEVRPVKIRSLCSQIAAEKATLKKDNKELPPNAGILEKLKHRDKDIFNSEEYEIYYDICLNEKGLK